MRNYVSAYLDQWMTITGLVFIATVLWAPNGFLGAPQKISKPTQVRILRSEPEEPDEDRG
jgi:hypothetical protein